VIERAILKINPKAEFSVNADDIKQITWLNGTKPISESDIQAQFTTVKFDIAMEKLRSTRDSLLAETDFYALSDVTMSDDMKTYRQNLRDITKGLDTVDKVNKVTMPTKPE
tara:strand:- start:234 stop:566 length:333 start_codon:yes stop_codon:yes gene_type:complete